MVHEKWLGSKKPQKVEIRQNENQGPTEAWPALRGRTSLGE